MNQFVIPKKYNLHNDLYVNNKISFALNVFWLGFIVYTSVYSFFLAPSINVVFWNRIQIGALILMVISSFSLIRFRVENSYLRFIFFLYVAWNLLTVARGIQLNYQFIYLSLVDGWFGMPIYLLPIILLFPRNIFYLRKVFTVIIVMGIIYLTLSIYFRHYLMGVVEDEDTNKYLMEYLSRNLSVPAGFLLISYIYHSRGRMLLVYIVSIVTLTLAILRARRAIIFMEVSYLIGYFFTYLFVSKAKSRTVILSLFLITLLSIGGSQLYNKYKNSFFANITERVDEDSRTGVEVCLYNDMNLKDWIIGKGMEGKYYCPGIDKGAFTDYRGMIETDYLNIILKGGIISLGLLLLITVPAMIKGIFYSNNLLSKAAGVWIFMWLTDLYPTVVDTFSMHYA
ncbi:MAG: hypothetical protein LC128_00225 [Chitinophagales bacterium]|nr:hypothetical protein [Chitinophagales bacterium]